jgi:hypothetical protein
MISAAALSSASPRQSTSIIVNTSSPVDDCGSLDLKIIKK